MFTSFSSLWARHLQVLDGFVRRRLGGLSLCSNWGPRQPRSYALFAASAPLLPMCSCGFQPKADSKHICKIATSASYGDALPTPQYHVNVARFAVFKPGEELKSKNKSCFVTCTECSLGAALLAAESDSRPGLFEGQELCGLLVGPQYLRASMW